MANQKVKDLPEYFTSYCDKPYDRHHYELYFVDGRFISFDDFEEMRSFWWQHMKNGQLSHVSVVDSIQKKAVVKGF